jgi:predicted aspartyl protease
MRRNKQDDGGKGAGDNPGVKRKRQSDMGTFYVRCKIENHVDRSKSVVVPKLLVDTGSDYTWIPATLLEKIGTQREKKDLPFIMANGQQITRSVGFVVIRLDKYFTIDEAVFAEKGDLPILGARTLEGLNLTVDPKRKKLVASGPLLVAGGAW